MILTLIKTMLYTQFNNDRGFCIAKKSYLGLSRQSRNNPLTKIFNQIIASRRKIKCIFY